MYQNDGDTQLLRNFYDRMALYVDYVSGLTVDGVLDGLYGDWLPPTGPMGGDIKLVETAYLYHDQMRMVDIARLTGHQKDAAHFTELATTTFASFNKAFLNRDRAMYFNLGEKQYHQTANALPLAFGLVPQELRQQVADGLAADVVAKGNHLDTGIIGTKELLPVLSASGHAALALAVAEQTTAPSWGYMLQKTHGRTGLWEAWSFDKVRSLNHMMYGTVGDWFYKNLAGIRPLAPGFASFAVDPDLSPGLDEVDATRETPYGTLRVAWDRQSGVLNVHVDVPVDAVAELWLPAEREDQVKEGGRPAAQSKDLTFLRKKNGRLVYRVGSGSYAFTAGP